jgi:hypothetical protein
VTDPDDHQDGMTAFEALCAGLEEYEPLPTAISGWALEHAVPDQSAAEVAAAAPDWIGGSQPITESGTSQAGRAEANLEAQILAGLVSP